MSDGFSGDPGHEGGSQPMAGLKGSCTGVHTQMPATSSAMDNPRSAAPAPSEGWTGFLAPTPAGTGNNDKAEAR